MGIIRAAVGEKHSHRRFAGSGKTTLTNGILRELAQLTPHDRVLVIEDTTGCSALWRTTSIFTPRVT
jgi:hypothetical protein